MYNFDFNYAVDAIFSLQSFTTKFTKSRRKTRCFVDYQKAFDFIIRGNLGINIKYYGIHGQLLAIIQSMFSDIRTRVKSSSNISQFFEMLLIFITRKSVISFFTLCEWKIFFLKKAICL